MCENRFRVGDRVRCSWPGSWVDGRTATITALGVVSTDGIAGHRVHVDGQDGYTVLPASEMIPIQPPEGA